MSAPGNQDRPNGGASAPINLRAPNGGLAVLSNCDAVSERYVPSCDYCSPSGVSAPSDIAALSSCQGCVPAPALRGLVPLHDGCFVWPEAARVQTKGVSSFETRKSEHWSRKLRGEFGPKQRNFRLRRRHTLRKLVHSKIQRIFVKHTGVCERLNRAFHSSFHLPLRLLNRLSPSPISQVTHTSSTI